VLASGAFIALSLLLCGNALADSCGVLPFTSGRGVNQGAADNITALVSSEVDIRGGFGLVLTATADELPKNCARKTSCIKKKKKKEDYERVVSGKVDGLGSSKYRITVTLWDINKGKEIRTVEHDMERSAGVLVMAIPDLVVELLTGKAPGNDDEDAAANVSVFDEVDFDEEEEDEDTSWMERDRRGRKIRRGGAESNDLLGLDDLDDLDLDDMTEESLQKKSDKKDERREREAKRRAEEERLEDLAREEQQRRNAERRRAEDERRQRDEEARAERERRAAERAETKRRERQEREARRQEEREDQRAEERRRTEDQRSAYTDYEDYEDYELEDDEGVKEMETTSGLGSGVVMVEDDEGDDEDYFGPEDDEELRPGDIIEYEDGDYTRRRSPPKEDKSYEYRRRGDDRLAYNDRGAPSRDDDDDLDIDIDIDIDLDSEGGRSSHSESYGVEFGRTRGAKDSSSYSGSSASATRRGSKAKRKGPLIAIKAGAGWTAYYPETLKLGMFDYGFEASFFAAPWLSVDAGVNFWSVSLIEYDDEGNSLRTVRTLPSFLFGATWHGTFHKVIRPYAGIDIGAMLYAQAVVQEGDSTQIRPLFAPTVAADVGVDFIIIPNFGVFVGGKFGVSYAARVQETVNSSWNPTTGLAEIWAGALIQF
jgi:hypothetical protein